jgi:hypothetical protein
MLYHKIPDEDKRDDMYLISRRGDKAVFSKEDIPTTLVNIPFILDVELYCWSTDTEDVVETWYIMDVLHWEGVSLKNIPFVGRLAHMQKHLANLDKKFVLLPYLKFDPKTLTQKTVVDSVPARTDGVVFTFFKDWVRQSRHRYKDVDTIDFHILPMEDDRMRVGLGVLVLREPLQGPSRIMNRSRRRQKIQAIEIFCHDGKPFVVNGEGLQINAIYEFRYDLDLEKFIVVRRRYDKIKPNKAFVASSIFHQIILRKAEINPFLHKSEEYSDESSSKLEPSSSSESM